MAYVTPPTFADADILTATQLNTLSADLEFLHGIVGGTINVPFASHRRIDNFDVTNNQYLIQHLNQYLHYKARLLANDNADLDIYYFGVRVFHDGTTRSAVYTYSGYIDLYDPSGWSDYIGTYAGGTTYQEHDIVLDGGVYYASLQNGNTGHATSDGAWWRSLGATGNLTPGDYYYLYITTNLSASPQFVLDYLLESSETTL